MNLNNLLVMIRNRSNREQIYSKAAYWDSKAAHYSGEAVSMWPNNNLNKLYHKEQLKVFLTYLPPPSGQRVLDVGCGTGRIARFLVQRGFTVDARDFSAKSIQIATSLSTSGNNPRYAVESVFDLNESEQYEAVVSWGVLAIASTNREELRVALSRIHRALKPGGRLLILEPFHRGFLHRVLNAGIQEVKEDLKASGFEVKAVHPMHFWPVRLLMAYIPLPMAVTRPAYYVGQFFMRLFDGFGDYTALYAERN